MSRRIVAALLLLLAMAGPAAAQSLFGAGGLGMLLEPTDARARSLGGLGVGLSGTMLLPADPSSAIGFALPFVTASLQPGSARATLAGQTNEASATRFPLLAVAYPVGTAGVATVSYGAYLDLRWSLRRRTVEEFAGQQVPVEDRFVSDGGVAALRVGWAQRVGQRLGIGAWAGVYTGQLTRAFTRQIDTVAAGVPVDSFSVRGEWSLTGPTVGLGASWEPVPIVRLAASLIWSGELRANPAEGSGDRDRREFTLPLELKGGVSARLTPQIAANLGVAWADWTATGRDLADGQAGAAWATGMGLEWTGSGMLGRSSPVRVGYRWAQLPFHIRGDAPRERAFTAGLGLILLEVEGRTVAGFDLAIERGARSADRLQESFWRGTFTVHLSGR
ncbi:MAG: hypothetical protein HY704_09120 [Gemmatimonadetes bacterium]|nr:hypothetical protein [Gemmatimonadota bacterium]